MKKVSFDFDSTLDRLDIQEFAKKLVSDGYEVWIVTTRLTNEKSPNPIWNDDLYDVAKQCGISTNNIHFTNGGDKWSFLENKGFIFHIDDDEEEYEFIRQYLDRDVIPVMSYGNKEWEKDCIDALNGIDNKKVFDEQIPPCKFDHNNECLVCDNPCGDCAWQRWMKSDFSIETEDELKGLFGDEIKKK